MTDDDVKFIKKLDTSKKPMTKTDVARLYGLVRKLKQETLAL